MQLNRRTMIVLSMYATKYCSHKSTVKYVFELRKYSKIQRVPLNIKNLIGKLVFPFTESCLFELSIFSEKRCVPSHKRCPYAAGTSNWGALKSWPQ